MNTLNRRNIWLVVKTFILVIILIGIKLILHFFGFEVISINALFSGIVAGNVFLMGFLLSGVLSDFKEAEKIPGEISSNLSAIYDEFLTIYENKQSLIAKNGMLQMQKLSEDLVQWFHKKIKTRIILRQIRGINHLVGELENETQATFIVRLKNEATSLKKTIIRTDTIRDTDFIASGYLIATIVTLLLCLGLTLAKIEPYYESLFFTAVISFLMIFLLVLIHDLDNPFNYSNKFSAENVSLYPLERIIEDIKENNSNI
ncbi:MAG: hypothetical protein WCR55_07735 [Lentisphaerota bacterium]